MTLREKALVAAENIRRCEKCEDRPNDPCEPCDEHIAEVIERVAKAFAEKVSTSILVKQMEELGPDWKGIGLGEAEKQEIQEAIKAAENDE